MKRIITCVLVLSIALLTLCACGGNGGEGEEINSENLAELKIGVGVGGKPQHDVFENMTSRLALKGYKPVYKEYNTPGEATEALAKGEIDVSLYETRAQFNEYEEKNPDVLLNLGSAYYFPYGIFLCNYEKRNDVAAGSTIIIPDDSQGMARALMLLEADGFIKLKEGAELSATLDDIAENENAYQISTKPADTLAQTYKSNEFDIVVMPSETAVNAGYPVHKYACAIEEPDSLAAKENSTVLLIKKDTLTSEKISTVQVLFFSPLMYDLIDDYPGDLIVPAFSISARG